MGMLFFLLIIGPCKLRYVQDRLRISHTYSRLPNARVALLFLFGTKLLLNFMKMSYLHAYSSLHFYFFFPLTIINFLIPNYSYSLRHIYFLERLCEQPKFVIFIANDKKHRCHSSQNLWVIGNTLMPPLDRSLPTLLFTPYLHFY